MTGDVADIEDAVTDQLRKTTTRSVVCDKSNGFVDVKSRPKSAKIAQDFVGDSFVPGRSRFGSSVVLDCCTFCCVLCPFYGSRPTSAFFYDTTVIFSLFVYV